jgi:hypothetical protein
MNKRKVFYHVLAKDLHVGDVALLIQPGYGRGEVCTSLVTVVSVGLRHYQIYIDGRSEKGNLITVLYEQDQLVPVVSNG